MTSAVERLKAAVANKPRGYRGPQGAQHLVEVIAGDVLAVCQLVLQVTEIVSALKMGSSAVKPHEEVYLHADDVHHLLEQATTAGA